jgi:membrane protein
MFDKLMSTPTTRLGRVGMLLVFQIKLWFHCFRLLKKNRAGQQAAALSYHTIFGLVPLTVVMLLIFQLFPRYADVGQKIKNSIYAQLHLSTIAYPDPANSDKMIQLTENMDQLVAKVFAGFNEGTIAILGALLIIWAAFALLSTTEGAFNHIWCVSHGRGFVQRIVNYWAILTLGPLLLGTAVYVATSYSAIQQMERTITSYIAPAVVSYIVAAVGFFVLYVVLPNAKVRVRAAVWGAIVAAIIWTAAKWTFALYVTKFIPYNQIYGILGLVPLSVFWIYVSWYIVLFGLQLTYTTQHLHSLDAAEIAAAQKSEGYFIASELTIMNIVGEIASAFESGGGVVEPAVVSHKLNIPAEFVEKILGHLVNAGVLVRVSEPKDGFMPAKNPANMKLADISEVVAKACFGQSVDGQSAGMQQVARMQREAFSHYTVKQLLEEQEQATPVEIGV